MHAKPIRFRPPVNFDPQTLRWTAPPFVAQEALRRLPHRLAAKFRREWLKRANGRGCAKHLRGLPADRRADEATLWLMEAVRPATGWAHKLDINADDGDIRAAAKVQSAAYFYENSRLLGVRGVMEKEAAQMGLDPLAAAAYRQAAYAAGVKKLCARATAEGVDVSRFAGAKQYRPEAVAARLCDKHFVARQMAKGFGRERENLLRSGFNGVHKRAALYASDEAVAAWRGRRSRNRALLEAMVMVNELGQEFALAELAEKSESNPRLRNAGLMVRIAGFETVADDLGHVGEFITLTCPSRFHAAAEASGERNPKYDGSTPRDASAYLQRVWARIRSALAKEDIKIYGFRVAEPHHDGCPHWHGLFFMPSEQRGRFREIVALHGCREDREELGLDYFLSAAAKKAKARQVRDAALARGGRAAKLEDIAATFQTEKEFWQDAKTAQFAKVKARVHFERIDKGRGSAAGYIAKYICKNIDGKNAFGESIGGDDEADGRDVVQTAERVLAWASLWGIRQFQQVGGVPVGVWRELRRLELEQTGLNHEDDLYRAAQAADAGDWGKFVMVMGGVDCRRDERPVQLYKEEQSLSNRYGEPRADRVRGVLETATGQYAISRVHVWEMRFGRGAAAAAGGKGGAAAPWTCVNNCRKTRFDPQQDGLRPSENPYVMNPQGFSAPDWEEIEVRDWLRVNGREWKGFIGDRERREYRRFAKEAADFFAGWRTSPDEMEAAVRDAREKAVAAREKSEALWRWREHLADLEAMSAGVAALFGRRPSENRMPPPAARPPGMMPLPQRKTVGDALEKSAQTRQRVAAWREQVARLAGAAH